MSSASQYEVTVATFGDNEQFRIFQTGAKTLADHNADFHTFSEGRAIMREEVPDVSNHILLMSIHAISDLTNRGRLPPCFYTEIIPAKI